MKQNLISTIQNIVPLSDDDVTLVESAFQTRKFKRNEVLLQAGTVARDVFFVVNGLLQQFYIDESGNERTCDFTFENKFVTDFEGFTKKDSFLFINQSIKRNQLPCHFMHSTDATYSRIKTSKQFF